ncbi:PQQ-binding-like beta-propeller repeat protein [Nocardiopsis sp. NPDC006938]|uniref:outer membrane protein assembly factor BamB family protein n=1 Tax=Nocardiopsis sp. NPDC006938 TaxID=3364337 RepID=UPI0036A81D5C
MSTPVRPSFSVGSARRRRRALTAFGLTGALLLTGCSTEEPEREPVAEEATVISPDTLVTCSDTGDCGAPGALRWSLPLEGEYVLHLPEDGLVRTPLARLYPVDLLVPQEHVNAGATVRDGVLHYQEHGRFRAFDLATMEELWAEEVDPGRAFRVHATQWVGERLVVHAGDNREWEGTTYLLAPGTDSLEWEAVDADTGIVLRGTPPANDTHVLLEGVRDSGTHHLVDAATGAVEWSASLGGEPVPGTLTDDAAFVVASQDDGPRLLRRVDLADGRVTDEVPLPEGLASRDHAALSPDGGLLVDDVGAVDTDTGELLWTHAEEPVSARSGFEWRARFPVDDPGLVYVQNGERTRVLDARTGETVREEAPDPPADLFGARQLWFVDGFDRDAHSQYRAPVQAYGPGVGDDLLIETAAGTHYLTTYRADDGAYVGVYQGCAPDGMRAPELDDPTPARVCDAPRLFAVDHGVAGDVPQSGSAQVR